MHPRSGVPGSITIMWSLNVFINDFTYLVGKQKRTLFSSWPIQSPTSRLNVFQLSSNVIGTLSYSKFEIVQLQREGSAAKSNVRGKMPFIF